MKIISNQEVSQLPVEVRLCIFAEAITNTQKATLILQRNKYQAFVQFVYKRRGTFTDYSGHRRKCTDNYLIRYYRDGHITIVGDEIATKDSRQDSFTLQEAIEFCYFHGAGFERISQPKCY